MASGFPTGAYCSKASQTPMSFCAASSVSTSTRTRKGMSSIVLPGFLVSVGGRWRVGRRVKLAKNCLGLRCIEVDWPCSTERHSGRDGYVLGKDQGWWTATRNLVTDPGVLTTDDRAPSSRGGGGEKYAGRQTPDFATPRHAQAFDRRSMGFPLSRTRV